MSDLILKEIYFKNERKNLTDNEIKKYKMTEREVFQKYENLSEHELNNQNDKEVSVRINVITSVTVNCTGEKKRAKKKKKKKKKKKGEFKRKLGFTKFDIMVLSEYSIKSKIGKIFVNEKYLKNIMSKFMKLILLFIRIVKKK